MGSWRAGIGPCSSVQAGVQCGIVPPPGQSYLRLPLDSKKSRFFRRPPRPDDACRRLKNPGEITLANKTSGTGRPKQISRATNKGTYHIRLPIHKEADSQG